MLREQRTLQVLIVKRVTRFTKLKFSDLVSIFWICEDKSGYQYQSIGDMKSAPWVSTKNSVYFWCNSKFKFQASFKCRVNKIKRINKRAQTTKFGTD